ncbi:PLD nuclease N-terminal domain-containing protein [Metabacillus fastidiosus]|uniref:PLD nuclease N-terminal domain-containing protein n=1 Tax=Metabacillus fastidiosus TaxID=1458 RepID=UPI003D2A8159
MQLNYGIDELDKIDLTTFLPIILPIAIIGFILVLTALIDLYRHRKTRRNLMLWTVIILFANTLGPILYFVIGRKDREQR